MILTLDLGQSTGWATDGGPGRPKFGTLKTGPVAGDDDIGRALADFLDQLAPLVRGLGKLDEIWIEAALPVAAVNNIAAQASGRPFQRMGREIDVQLQYMLAGAVRTLGHRLRIPVRNARVNTVRAHFLRGVPEADEAGKKIGVKDRVILAACRRGWPVANPHEADAAAILSWRLAQTARGLGL